MLSEAEFQAACEAADKEYQTSQDSLLVKLIAEVQQAIIAARKQGRKDTEAVATKYTKEVRKDAADHFTKLDGYSGSVKFYDGGDYADSYYVKVTWK